MAARKKTKPLSRRAAVATRRPSKTAARPRVAVLMGSASDGATMQAASDVLESLGVGCDVRVISAHRTPERHARYVRSADKKGIELFICGAGFAAHLAGVTAALTPLPVLGVPLDSSPLDGLDSLLSTVQMPGGIPVATFGIGKSGAKNAGLFAAAMLARSDARVRRALVAYRKRQTEAVPLKP